MIKTQLIIFWSFTVVTLKESHFVWILVTCNGAIIRWSRWWIDYEIIVRVDQEINYKIKKNPSFLRYYRIQIYGHILGLRMHSFTQNVQEGTDSRLLHVLLLMRCALQVFTAAIITSFYNIRVSRSFIKHWSAHTSGHR